MEPDLISLISRLLPNNKWLKYFIDSLLWLVHSFFRLIIVLAPLWLVLVFIVNFFHYIFGVDNISYISLSLRHDHEPIVVTINDPLESSLKQHRLLYSSAPQKIILTTNDAISVPVEIRLFEKQGVLIESQEQESFTFSPGASQSYALIIQNDLSQSANTKAYLRFQETILPAGITSSIPYLEFEKEPYWQAVVRRVLIVASGEVVLTVVPLLIVVLAAAAWQIEQRGGAPPVLTRFIRLAREAAHKSEIDKAYEDLKAYSKYLDNAKQRKLIKNYNLSDYQLIHEILDKNSDWRDVYFGIVLSREEHIADLRKILIDGEYLPYARLIPKIPLGYSVPEYKYVEGGSFIHGQECAEDDVDQNDNKKIYYDQQSLPFDFNETLQALLKGGVITVRGQPGSGKTGLFKHLVRTIETESSTSLLVVLNSEDIADGMQRIRNVPRIVRSYTICELLRHIEEVPGMPNRRWSNLSRKALSNLMALYPWFNPDVKQTNPKIFKKLLKQRLDNSRWGFVKGGPIRSLLDRVLPIYYRFASPIYQHWRPTKRLIALLEEFRYEPLVVCIMQAPDTLGDVKTMSRLHKSFNIGDQTHEFMRIGLYIEYASSVNTRNVLPGDAAREINLSEWPKEKLEALLQYRFGNTPHPIQEYIEDLLDSSNILPNGDNICSIKVPRDFWPWVWAVDKLTAQQTPAPAPTSQTSGSSAFAPDLSREDWDKLMLAMHEARKQRLTGGASEPANSVWIHADAEEAIKSLQRII